ncbi:unnamed protein product [Trichobilharzia szidati]|nr:unnamed protein product [Trichobilharzia szidati]
MVPRTVNNGTSGNNNDNLHRGMTDTGERYGRGSCFSSHHSRYSMHNQYQQGLQQHQQQQQLQQHHLNALQAHHASTTGLNDPMMLGDDCGSEPNSLAALLAPPSKQPRQHLATDAVTAAALARGDALDAYSAATRAMVGLENAGVIGGTHPPCVSLREAAENMTLGGTPNLVGTPPAPPHTSGYQSSLMNVVSSLSGDGLDFVRNLGVANHIHSATTSYKFLFTKPHLINMVHSLVLERSSDDNLSCTIEGEVSAIECRDARSNTISHGQKLQNKTDDTVTSEETTKPEKIQKVSYPPLLTDLLTKQKALNIPKMDDYSMAQQNEILDNLHKLKCNTSDEPIATAIHGPLTIFSPMQLVQLSEVYSSDPSLIEYAVSLLKFVQPVGRWARRWVAKRLDAATDGLHSQAVYALQSQYDNDKTELLQSWFDEVDLTIDPPTPKSDEVDTEHLEPCLLDLLMDDDTVTSCNSNTNGPVLPTDNEHVSLITDVQISCIKNGNINSVNTSNLSNPVDVTLTADSCGTSFYNTSVSASEVTVSAPSSTIIPQQNSSLNNELDDVIICDSLPSSVSTSTPCENITAPSDIQSIGQVALVATKPSEGQALSDECASNVKVVDDVVCSSFSSLSDLKSDCFVHVKSGQTSEAPSDSSTSLLKTALSAASSYSLSSSHDRIVVQNKVILNAGEDSTKNLSSSDGLTTTMPATSLQHSLFLDSHLITHKEIPAVETHAENSLPVNQSYDTINYAEANSSTVCQLQNSCVRICVDMDASSTSSTDTENAKSLPLSDLISSDISQTNHKSPETNADNTLIS